MRNLVWILLAIGLIALLFIYLEQNGLTLGDLGGGNLPSPAVSIVVAAALGVLALALFERAVLAGAEVDCDLGRDRGSRWRSATPTASNCVRLPTG